jgi:hypothetical protein
MLENGREKEKGKSKKGRGWNDEYPTRNIERPRARPGTVGHRCVGAVAGTAN